MEATSPPALDEPGHNVGRPNPKQVMFMGVILGQPSAKAPITPPARTREGETMFSSLQMAQSHHLTPPASSLAQNIDPFRAGCTTPDLLSTAAAAPQVGSKTITTRREQHGGNYTHAGTWLGLCLPTLSSHPPPHPWIPGPRPRR
ncbi:hypothetical protein TcBrA4_0020790 [Trypanosoma cruzi]|nr:hypothetical protein TcBrA4_0020790 [Trypanosoma cruzi]